MLRASLIVLLFPLAACGFRDPTPAPLLSIAEGRYGSVIGGACLTLEFGRRDRQTLAQDADCDGAPEAVTDVVVTNNLIETSAGTMTVTAVGASSFSGLWRAGDAESQARFDRVEG